jgi:hypothetical protein
VPVRRLRSLQEAEDTLVRSPDDPMLWQAVASLWALSDRLFPRRFPPGLRKHRSIEELNEQREHWERQAIEAAR